MDYEAMPVDSCGSLMRRWRAVAARTIRRRTNTASGDNCGGSDGGTTTIALVRGSVVVVMAITLRS